MVIDVMSRDEQQSGETEREFLESRVRKILRWASTGNEDLSKQSGPGACVYGLDYFSGKSISNYPQEYLDFNGRYQQNFWTFLDGLGGFLVVLVY